MFYNYGDNNFLLRDCFLLVHCVYMSQFSSTVFIYTALTVCRFIQLCLRNILMLNNLL